MNDSKSRFYLVEELIKFHFSEALQSGYQAYRNDCYDYYLENQVLLEETKEQLQVAVANSDYDWKEISKRNGFFRYTDLKTSEELLLDIKVLVWDIFFPDVVLDTEEKAHLRKELLLMLSNEVFCRGSNKLEFTDVLYHLNRKSTLNREVNNYDLLTLFYDPYLLFRGDQIIWGFYRDGTPSWTLYTEVDTHHLKLDHSLVTQEWVVSLTAKPSPAT